jgi:hypothetical protein
VIKIFIYISSYFTFAHPQVSLGDVKTLASAPGLSTQQQVPLEDRLKTGIKSTTIRMSVGMENVIDVCSDIGQALLCAVPVEPSGSSSSSSVEVAHIADALQAGVCIADTKAIPSVVATTLKERTTRLKALYDQMNAITAEVEELQAAIKADSLLLQEK